MSDPTSFPIAYYPALIPELVDDHRTLLGIYENLHRAAETQDTAGLKTALASFRSLLIAHLLKEAVRLYIYLRQQFKHDAAVYARVTAYKREMDGIGKVAMEFIDTHLKQPDDVIDFAQLRASLHDLGRVLGDRVRREEAELYPLYQPTH